MKYVKLLSDYAKYLKKISKDDPEQAEKEAIDSLKRTGIIDENLKLKPPYNGIKVNENDFEMGPKLVLKR